MHVFQYLVTIRHDAGIIRITTTATSAESAIAIIMQSEGCPRSAIKSVKIID